MRKIRVNMTIDEDLDEWLGKIAGELRMNKNQFINNVISATKDDVKVLRAIGLFNLRKMERGGKGKGGNVAIKKIPVNMIIDEDLNEWLERMAAELRMNKSQFMNNVITATKDDVRVLKAIGLFSVGKMVMKVKEKVQKVKMENIPLKGERAK